MWNFQGIAFIWTLTYREIFTSVLVYPELWTDSLHCSSIVHINNLNLFNYQSWLSPFPRRSFDFGFIFLTKTSLKNWSIYKIADQKSFHKHRKLKTLHMDSVIFIRDWRNLITIFFNNQLSGYPMVKFGRLATGPASLKNIGCCVGTISNRTLPGTS